MGERGEEGSGTCREKVFNVCECMHAYYQRVSVQDSLRAAYVTGKDGCDILGDRELARPYLGAHILASIFRCAYMSPFPPSLSFSQSRPSHMPPLYEAKEASEPARSRCLSNVTGKYAGAVCMVT